MRIEYSKSAAKTLQKMEKGLRNHIMKRLVLAWDPDFTKLTAVEAEAVQKAEDEIARGETVSDDAIDWDA